MFACNIFIYRQLQIHNVITRTFRNIKNKHFNIIISANNHNLC